MPLRNNKKKEEYILLSYNRKDINRNNSMTKYRCCECNKVIGDIESIIIHYVDNHQNKYNLMKNILNSKESLYFKSRVDIINFL